MRRRLKAGRMSAYGHSQSPPSSIRSVQLHHHHRRMRFAVSHLGSRETIHLGIAAVPQVAEGAVALQALEGKYRLTSGLPGFQNIRGPWRGHEHRGFVVQVFNPENLSAAVAPER